MRVNEYDPENVEKGKQILMNIADGLSEYAKIKTLPDTARKHSSEKEGDYSEDQMLMEDFDPDD